MFFVIALIFAVYSFFVLIPQIQSIFLLNSEISEAEAKYQLYSGYEQKLKGVEENGKLFVEELSNIREAFPPNMSHSDIYVLFQLLSEYSGVGFKNLNISDAKEIKADGNIANSAVAITDPQLIKLANEMGIRTLNKTNLTSTQNSSENEIEQASSEETTDKALKGPYNVLDGNGYVIEIATDSSGTDEQFKKLFSVIKDIPSQINIKQINFVPRGEIIDATFVLQLYGIKDQARDFEGFFKKGSWQPLPVGKDVVWSKAIGLKDSTLSRGESNKEIETFNSYDFTMRIVPYGNSMAPSTISMSARNLTQKSVSGLIYGDNRLVEQVELHLSEKNGKLYCKYRTQTEAFPDKAFSQTAEFKVLRDNMVLGIDSIKRTYADDKSGVNLKIYNGTSKRLDVEVLNDDPDMPRVKVEKMSGSIELYGR